MNGLKKESILKNKISVIIPVYNVEPYLKKCVDSVINQSYKNLEIILVDDGSTDKSGDICDEYKKNEQRIIVVHQENKGLSAARNVGLELATGEWIGFLDSDDWIMQEMYEVLLNLAIEHNADISTCNTKPFYLDSIENFDNGTGKVTELSSDQMIEGLLTQEKVRFEVWNKLWSRELIGEVRFIVGQVSEDVHFDRILFLKANKMIHIDCALHNYLIQRPGNTNSSFKKNRMCIFGEFDKLIQELKSKNKYHLIEIVNCIVSEFAIGIFEVATETNQDEMIKNELIQQFNSHYSFMTYLKYRTLRESIKTVLFWISPKIFLIVRKGVK